jgi:putative nucleotidyltransferase with HDIG domain
VTAEELARNIGALPTLPGVVFRLQALLEEDGAQMTAVAHLIGQDPVMTARLLQAANSSFFGVRRPVTTVEQALVLLGIHMVRNLLVMTSVHATLRRFRLSPEFGMLRYWEHSLVTGVISKLLAARMPRLALDDAFVCGLLHDVGKVAMASFFTDSRAIVLTPSAFSSLEVERSVFGLDHVEVGRALANHWRLPPLVAEAIQHHHEPEQESLIARVVHSADLLAHFLFPGRKGTEMFHQIPAYVAEKMAMPPEDLDKVAQEARSALAEANAIATQ